MIAYVSFWFVSVKKINLSSSRDIGYLHTRTILYIPLNFFKRSFDKLFYFTYNTQSKNIVVSLYIYTKNFLKNVIEFKINTLKKLSTNLVFCNSFVTFIMLLLMYNVNELNNLQ